MKKKIILIALLAIAMIVILAALMQAGTNSDTNIFGMKTGSIRGTLDGQTYENNFFGFSVTLPKDWNIYNEDQIKEANGYSNGDLNNNAIDRILSDNSCYLDEIAGNDDGTSINVMVNKLSLFESIVYDEDKIVNVAVTSLKSQLETAGYSNVSATIEEGYSFCNETRNSIKISMKKDKQRIIKREFVFKNGRYYGTVTVSGSDTDTVDDVCALFEGR